jgi:hypothetical protein
MPDRPDEESPRILRRHALRLIGLAGAATTGFVSAMVPDNAFAKPNKGRGKGRGKGKGKGGGWAHCLLAGTRILTTTGEVPIECLRIGDLVLTLDRGPATVRWIGRQSFRRSSNRPWAASIAPVIIRAHAIAPNVPKRDLYLSRSHAIWADGQLLPPYLLVNGRSIAAAPANHLDRLDYFHLEVEGHQVVLAEGLGVETFGGRTREHFSNFAEYLRLYGADEPVTPRHPEIYGSQAALKGLALTLAAPLLGTEDPIRRVHRSIADRAAELRECD